MITRQVLARDWIVKYLQLASVYHVTVQLGMQLEVRASLRCWSKSRSSALLIKSRKRGIFAAADQLPDLLPGIFD